VTITNMFFESSNCKVLRMFSMTSLCILYSWFSIYRYCFTCIEIYFFLISWWYHFIKYKNISFDIRTMFQVSRFSRMLLCLLWQEKERNYLEASTHSTHLLAIHKSTVYLSQQALEMQHKWFRVFLYLWHSRKLSRN